MHDEGAANSARCTVSHFVLKDFKWKWDEAEESHSIYNMSLDKHGYKHRFIGAQRPKVAETINHQTV